MREKILPDEVIDRPKIQVERLGFEPYLIERMYNVFVNDYLYTCSNVGTAKKHTIEGIELIDERFCRIWSGDTKKDGSRIWNDEFIRLIWLQCAKKFKFRPTSDCERVYLNQQTVGNVGYWHPDYYKDSEDDVRHTIIYYPSLNHKNKHKGTQFLVEDEIIEVDYHTGYAVCFESHLWHRGLDTDDYEDNRMSLVFHTVDFTRQQQDMFKEVGGVLYD